MHLCYCRHQIDAVVTTLNTVAAVSCESSEQHPELHQDMLSVTVDTR